MSLLVPIGIKNAAFKAGLDEMRGQAAKFSADIKGMFVGAFAVGAITAGFKSWLDEMGRVDDLSQRLGETGETIQRVGQASSLAGADLEMVVKTLDKVTQKAGEAAGGNEAMAETFANLGINAAEFAAMPLEEKLVALSQAYVDSGGSASKLLAIQDLLGAKGADLIPLLAAGPEALKQSLDEANISSDAAVKAAAKFGDTLEKAGNLGKIAFGYILQAGLTVTTVLAAGVTQLGLVYVGLFETVQKVATGISAALTAMWKGDLSTARDALGGIRSDVAKTFQDFTDRSSASADTYATQLAEIWSGPSTASAPEKLAIDFEAAAEAAKKAKDEAEKLKKLQEDLAATEKRNREAAMSDEERLQAMISERNDLLKKANDTTEEGLTAKKAAAELEGKIADAQRKAEKDKSDRDKQYQDKLAAAREAEASVDEQNKLAGMSKDERRDYFRDKQAKLNKDAAAAEKSGDQLKATELRTEAKRLESELRPEEKSAAKPTLNVVASSLAAVGGGGNVGAIAQDPLLRAQERGNNLLERIANAVEGGRGENRKPSEVL